MEVLLGVFAILTVGYIINGMIDGSSFYQSFYAKDNAHIIEGLHAVPNGEMHLAYLWSSRDYEVNIVKARAGEISHSENANRVTVRRVDAEKEEGEFEGFGGSGEFGGGGAGGSWGDDQVTANAVQDTAAQAEQQAGAQAQGLQERTKYFGASSVTAVTPTGFFQPQFYQYIARPGQQRSITVQRHFNKLECPASQVALGSVQVNTVKQELSSTEEEAVDRYAGDLVQQMAYRQQGQQAGEPLAVTLVVRHSPIERRAVLYNQESAHVQRATCLVAQGLSTDEENVEYGSAGRAERGHGGDMIVVIHTADVSLVQQTVVVIAESLGEYGVDQ